MYIGVAAAQPEKTRTPDSASKAAISAATMACGVRDTSKGYACMYVCMYVKIRRHQHTRAHAHTGPRRHARAPACRRHHIPRLVRRQAFHADHQR